MPVNDTDLHLRLLGLARQFKSHNGLNGFNRFGFRGNSVIDSNSNPLNPFNPLLDWNLPGKARLLATCTVFLSSKTRRRHRCAG